MRRRFTPQQRIERPLAGELDSATTSVAKYWTTEAKEFSASNPIAGLHRDARAYRLSSDTTEFKKTIIGRSLLVRG